MTTSEPKGRLHDLVVCDDRRDAQRPPLGAPALGDIHPSRGPRAITLLFELYLELIEERVDPTVFDLGDRDAVNPGSATVLAHLLPRPLKDIPAMDAIPERVEA
ncbi:MAG: hypothetical protein LC790_12255, partial [Actinobacteria bacterium]|nr:hypothetical protein [Actinomycetota bacterium]